MMYNRFFIVIIVAITCAFVFALSTHAQKNVRLEGRTFVVDSAMSQDTKTEYKFRDKSGNTYDVYLSAKGKAYIYAVSKKTGTTYKRYLPEITEKIATIKRQKRWEQQL